MLFVKASKREAALILLLVLASAGSAFGQMNYFDPVNNKWICYPWNVQWASNWVCNTPPVGSAAFAGGITWGPSNHVCMGGLTGTVGVAITDNSKYLEGKDQCGTYYQMQSYPPSTNIWCDIVGPGVTSSLAGTTAVIPTPLPGPGMVTFHMMWSNLPPCSGSGSNAVAGAYAVYNVQFQSNNVYKCIEDSNYLSSANLDLPMTYDANHLAWSMGEGGAGATIDPASGLVTFGSNGAVCAVTATSPDVPCATAAYSLYVEQLTLKLSKEYLGIDLTGPPAQTNAISATAALTPDLSWTQFVWSLPGPCIFDPAPPAPNASEVSIKETHQPSAAVSGEVVSVSKFCGQAAKFTVVKLDITMPGTTELDEETEGGTLAINQDDDNTNNVLDLSDQPAMNENDLVSISFTLLPTGLPSNQMVTITAANLYEDAFKMTNAKAVYCVTNFPLNLWLEGHSASGAAADQFINVFHPDSGAKDKTSYTVIQADLDPHKLFDQKTAVVPDELEENKGGGYAILNDDDMSPANLQWDLNDAVAGKFGDDRIWDLPLTANPPLSNATMKLEWTSSGSGAIKVYNAKTNPLVEISTGAVFPGTNVPPLKVEGVNASDAMQDINMTATYQRGAVESVDKIKLTVVSVDVDGDSNGNGKGAITAEDDKVEGDSRYPVGVFFNDTDNDQDGVVDNAESVTNGPGDLSELSDLWIQKVKPDNISTGTVILTDGSNVRLFAQLAGNWVSVKEPGSPSIDLWTNLPVNLKAEGVTAGTDPLTVTYRYTNQWGGVTEFKDMLYVGVFRADLDIDSANTSDFGAPAGTPFEDAIETGSTNPIYNALKYVVVDDYYNEDNTNGIPGYATNQLTGTLGPKADYQFVPVHFQIFAPFPDTSETGVKFHYTASPPGNVTVGSSGGETTYTPAAGNLRLWLHEESTQRNTNSVLAGGDFIPADVDISADKLGGLGLKTFYLEGISPSVGLGAEEISVIVTNAVVVSNAAARAEDKIKCTVIKVDVDVDSFNNDAFTVPTDDPVEDQYEDVTNRPGKIISVNDNDDDHDGIPDFADGYDLYPGVANDNATANEQFVPIVFRLPAPIDLTTAKVRVKYDASLPWAVTTNASGQYIAPATGKLRIWRKDGSNGTRSTNSIANGGDFVVPEEECTAAQFGFGGTVRSIPFFLEAVQPSEKLADLRIRFEVDPDGTVTGKPSPSFIAADAARLTGLKVEFVHAEGDIGQHMEYLPVYTPSLGANAGVPNYDCPDADVRLSFAGALNSNTIDTIVVSYLGTTNVAAETGVNTLSFTNETLSVTLSGTPLADPDVQESITACVSFPPCGITNALYQCTETSASSSTFDNDLCGLVLSLSDLASNNVDTAHLTIISSIVNACDLAETATNSRCFASPPLTVSLMANATLTTNVDILLLSISDSHDFSNTVFKLQETGAETKIFRNFDDPTPTSISDISVPSFLPWRVKIHGISDPNLVASVELRTSVEVNSQGTFSTVASLLSDQKFILVPASVNTQVLPNEYQHLKVDDNDLDWKAGSVQDVHVDIQLVSMATPVSLGGAKAHAGAAVLQSLNWGSSVWQSLDPESRIRLPLLAMGYSAIHDYNAAANETLTTYIKGKQVWYSMSHGGTLSGTPYSQFTGLAFKDGEIKAAGIQPLGLKYRLVIVDGCCSAQTSTESKYEAKQNNTLTSGAKTFADAFGPDSAYMGWGWAMSPLGSQTWSGEFVANLQFVPSLGRGRTVQEAYDKFIQDNIGNAPAAALMKIYKNTGNVIDLRKSN